MNNVDCYKGIRNAVGVLTALVALSLFSNSANSQSIDELYGIEEGMHYVNDEYAFAPARTYSMKDAIRYNDADFFSHPDMGRLTFNAPYDRNVVEVISKRTEYSKYFVDIDNPQFFYIQQSSRPMNMMKDGYMRAIDPALRPSADGVYSSGVQKFPTELNLNAQHSKITMLDEWITFNHFTLKVIHNDGTEAEISPDWSNAQVGNFGAYITDVFPNIDMRLKYGEAMIKSEFIVKENPNVKSLVLIDHMGLSENLDLFVNDDLPAGQKYVEVYNTETAETWGSFRPAQTYDSSLEPDTYFCDYVIDGDNVNVICDSSILNNPDIEWPLIIDPTFTAVGPVSSALFIDGSRLFPNYCTNSLIVSFPGGSTPWDVQIYWDIGSSFCAVGGSCFMENGYVYVSSSCGGASPAGAPPGWWNCSPGCAAPGAWAPTIGFAASGTQSLAQCYTPSCSAQDLTFTLHNTRNTCAEFAPFDVCNYADAWCNYVNQWTITVQGRSVETLGDTATGSGTTTIFDADCAGSVVLDPIELYGVPPYTYLWSTTETTGTITVPATTATYTCVVTDACLNSVTATFNISCPLSVDMLDFGASVSNKQVYLDWQTGSEENNSHFIVQRRNALGDFQDLGKVKANGTINTESSYQFIDSYPELGTNYYRLAIHDMDGNVEYSEVISADIDGISPLTLVPNPSTGLFTAVIAFDKMDDVSLTVRDINGRIVLSTNLESAEDMIDGSDIAVGVYQVELHRKGVLLDQQKLIIQK